MSEYQYYEFRALDRPLNREEQEQLRAISSRARITATSFTNTYNWGDLSGNPRQMIERYFDAHLYVTNWGTHRLILRLPKQALPQRTVQPYCLDHRIETWTTRTHLLLDLTSEDEDGDWIEGADDSLAALIGVRDELAVGDLRPGEIIQLHIGSLDGQGPVLDAEALPQIIDAVRTHGYTITDLRDLLAG
ncbi:hypothetical protein [Streptomyces violascens]|uniref:hypothetical protein n=1 Tax=Streptomyces violascens TaxID=67381 RepID=UPI00365D6622